MIEVSKKPRENKKRRMTGKGEKIFKGGSRNVCFVLDPEGIKLIGVNQKHGHKSQ